MRPLLRDGELVPVLPAEPGSYAPGDVVLYRLDGRLLLHRVRRVDAGGLWVQDDTGSVALHRVPARCALGRPDVRRPFLRGRPGLFYSRVNTALFVAARALKRLALRAG